MVACDDDHPGQDPPKDASLDTPRTDAREAGLDGGQDAGAVVDAGDASNASSDAEIGRDGPPVLDSGPDASADADSGNSDGDAADPDAGIDASPNDAGTNTEPSSFVFRNNLWFAHNAPGQSQPSLPTPETGGVYGVNPWLNGRYQPAQAPGPAAGAGIRLPEVSVDIDSRCYRNPPSVGAFEI